MICESMRKDLFSYIDGDLGHSREHTLREHLNECASCSREYHRILNAWNFLDEWEETTPPACLRKSILDGIRPKKKSIPVNMAFSAAAGLLIIVAAAFFFKRAETPVYRQLTSSNGSVLHPLMKDIPGELEDDIISNLNLLTEKEFYDSFDRLEDLDYLPLVEDRNDSGEDRQSALEALFV